MRGEVETMAAAAGLPAAETAVLLAECAGDADRFHRLAARRRDGEPMAYLLGWLEYRGRRFAVDRRAYITDPETSHMVDAVIGFLHTMPDGDSALVAELGTGCGAIAVSLLLAKPGLRLVGLEIDAPAIPLARENAAAYGVSFDLLESDLFSAWGGRPEPRVVFGDLPWGDDTSLYDSDRSALHYHAMPAASAFPKDGRTGMHRAAMLAVGERGWRSDIFLNFGVLPPDEMAATAEGCGARMCEILRPAPNVSILHCRMH